MITLYDCATAPSPRRARIFLAEKGIRHETVNVDLRSGEQLLRNGSPAMANRALPGPRDYPQIPELAQRGLARLHEFFAVLDARLHGREFLATERFSVADIAAAVAVDFARVVEVKPGDQHPNLLRWRAGLAQRPSMAL